MRSWLVVLNDDFVIDRVETTHMNLVDRLKAEEKLCENYPDSRFEVYGVETENDCEP